MYYQQGDVIVEVADKVEGEKLNHLILAEGDVTGHIHRITSGEAALYNMQGALYLKVISDHALLTHEEHGKIVLPKGDYVVRKVLEYDHWADEIREVAD